MADISETLAPKSDQLDNIDLRGSEPRIFTITKVDVNAGAEQPVTVHLAEFPRPWKPGKNMRRVLAHCWGRESDGWVGKRVELFSDERVKFGNETPGGTRISRLSGIDKPTSAPVMLSQGRGGTYKVDPLPNLAPADVLRAEWKSATPERRAAIEAEVAALQTSGAEDAGVPQGPGDVDAQATGQPQAMRADSSAPEPPTCPECAAGKHVNCSGQAWDNEADAPTDCSCTDGHES